MDSDQGKLFVGGISFETTEDKLRDYFSKYGEVYQVNIMRDKLTGRPRGFGFIIFSDPSVLDSVLQETHIIDGRSVDTKRAMSREDQQNSGRGGNNNGGRNSSGGGNFRTKKIFVGGLPPTLTDEGFRQYFENYGHVTDVVIMFDQNTNRPRGFGFISFDNEDAVDRVLQNTFHDLGGKQVEVKRATPKEANSSMSSRGGGYNSGGGQNAYDSRMDSSRYMQAQNAGGGFPPYGAAGYGYGPANAAMGYGGYGVYGGATPGYGGPASAAYGNPSANAARSSWNSQAAGYGAAGYGSGGPTGQSPGGTYGYGNQGFGYGNYGGGSDGYGNRVGGAAGNNASVGGGEMQGAYGSGYGGANGQGGYGAGGYGAQGNGAHGSQTGYGGGHGGAQSQ